MRPPRKANTSKYKQIVSVHFRRGDYISLASLNLKLGYYKKALRIFSPQSYKLFIFSDDIEYCKTLKIFSKYDVAYISGNNAGEDLCLMSLCDHNIIANSTFSFWGAMLNQNLDKKVVCPEKFIGKKDKENSYINGNYYPATWIPIKISEFYIIQCIFHYFEKNMQRFLNLLYRIKRRMSKILCPYKK